MLMVTLVDDYHHHPYFHYFLPISNCLCCVCDIDYVLLGTGHTKQSSHGSEILFFSAFIIHSLFSLLLDVTFSSTIVSFDNVIMTISKKKMMTVRTLLNRSTYAGMKRESLCIGKTSGNEEQVDSHRWLRTYSIRDVMETLSIKYEDKERQRIT